MQTQEEYEKELERLRKNRDSNQESLEELIELNEEDYCEIRYEQIIQWENSGTVYDRDITIHRLRREIELLRN